MGSLGLVGGLRGHSRGGAKPPHSCLIDNTCRMTPAGDVWNGQVEIEVLKESRATGVRILQAGSQYRVEAAGEIVLETRVLAGADAEYQFQVEERLAPQRARLASERALGAYVALASENGAQRAAKTRRGGKGGRGGV